MRKWFARAGLLAVGLAGLGWGAEPVTGLVSASTGYHWVKVSTDTLRPVLRCVNSQGTLVREITLGFDHRMDAGAERQWMKNMSGAILLGGQVAVVLQVDEEYTMKLPPKAGSAPALISVESSLTYYRADGSVAWALPRAYLLAGVNREPLVASAAGGQRILVVQHDEADWAERGGYYENPAEIPAWVVVVDGTGREVRRFGKFGGMGEIYLAPGGRYGFCRFFGAPQYGVGAHGVGFLDVDTGRVAIHNLSTSGVGEPRIDDSGVGRVISRRSGKAWEYPLR